MDRIIYDLVKEREAGGVDNGDLLSMLMQGEETGGNGRASHRQVRDEAMTLIAAGHETTANLLTWAWYLVSEHPEVEAKMKAELDSVLNGRPPGANDLPQLSYTEQVLTETTRLYPPSWANVRRAAESLRIGEYEIPKGAYVIVSQYVTQRDHRWFPDPLSFVPERWTSEFRASIPRYAYFPFGAGPRRCVGESFAWMEGTLVLATIAQHWRLKLAGTHPIEADGLITLRPKHGMGSPG